MTKYSDFRYAVEVQKPLDFASGAVTFDEAVKIIHNNFGKSKFGDFESVSFLCDMIEFALNLVLERYGEVREYHLFFIPAFLTEEPTGDSELIIAVKADNNGTTLVFSKSWILPTDIVCRTYHF